MVKINKIYTKTGDDGMTWVIGGERICKSSKQISAIGEVDELNAWIGRSRTLAIKSSNLEMVQSLEEIQQTLFDIGAILACSAGTSHPSIQQIDEADTVMLEKQIDQLTDSVPELRSFILPGGDEVTDALHIARTVCRRAERAILALHAENNVDQNLRNYINRLSDFLFALARAESFRHNSTELLWVPKQQRRQT